MQFIETDCTIEHEGHKFTANGAYVTGHYAAGYINGNKLTTWKGETIGTARIVKTWRVSTSPFGTYMHQIECLIDGVMYTGRGQGDGMIWQGKRKAAK
jgi:hypothetical protein